MSVIKVCRMLLRHEIPSLTHRLVIDNLRQILRGWSNHARSSVLRKESLAIVTVSVQDNLKRAAILQWRYKARSLVLDPMVNGIDNHRQVTHLIDLKRPRCHSTGPEIRATCRRRSSLCSLIHLESQKHR